MNNGLLPHSSVLAWRLFGDVAGLALAFVLSLLSSNGFPDLRWSAKGSSEGTLRMEIGAFSIPDSLVIQPFYMAFDIEQCAHLGVLFQPFCMDLNDMLRSSVVFYEMVCGCESEGFFEL